MDGVTILAENAVYELSKMQLAIVMGLFAACLLCLILGFIFASNPNFVMGCIVSFMFILFTAIVCLIAMKPQTFTEYEYKVIVNDTVNFNEFQEQYEILGQEGQIYTIRERN